MSGNSMGESFNLTELNISQLDFFRELENIGASHAATALSVMLNESITLKVPRVQFCEFNDISNILNGPENLVVGILVEISGDISGFILLVQGADDGKQLAQMLTNAMGVGEEEEPEDDFFTDLQRSAMMEVANILSGSYITAISTLTGIYINCSVPKMVIDMAGAVMNLPVIAYGQYGDYVLFLETEFYDSEKSISGHFFLIPDVDSYQLLMEKMGIK